MIKKLLATTALVAAPLMANAADLPMKARPAAPATAFSWAGWYIGGTIGYAQSSLREEGNSYSVRTSGVTGGLHGGHNWQSGNYVFGVEADVAATAIPGRFDHGSSTSFSSRLTATLRGRLGVAFNQNLLYATGGLSMVNGRLITDDDDAAPYKNIFGYVVGGGWEHAFNNHLIFRVVEGQYHGYNKTVSWSFDCDGACESGKVQHIWTVRTGFSYKF